MPTRKKRVEVVGPEPLPIARFKLLSAQLSRYNIEEVGTLDFQLQSLPAICPPEKSDVRAIALPVLGRHTGYARECTEAGKVFHVTDGRVKE